MELRTEQLAEGIEKISLIGRLDSAGTQEIDMRFSGRLKLVMMALAMLELGMMIRLLPRPRMVMLVAPQSTQRDVPRDKPPVISPACGRSPPPRCCGSN